MRNRLLSLKYKWLVQLDKIQWILLIVRIILKNRHPEKQFKTIAQAYSDNECHIANHALCYLFWLENYWSMTIETNKGKVIITFTNA